MYNLQHVSLSKKYI